MLKIGHWLREDFLGYFTRSGRADTTRRSKRWGAYRVGAYATTIGALTILYCAHGAKASAGESVAALGRDLAPLADMLGTATAVELNGERMTLGSAISDEPVKTVLDRFEEHCDANPSKPLADLWQKVEQMPANERPAEAAQFKKGYVVRSGDEHEGTIVCFTGGEKTQSSFVKAWEKFSESRDLGYLGKARFAFVHKDKFDKTIILTAWTEDSFNLDKVSPSDGSEPQGTDSASVPRPGNSKRILSARILDKPYGVRVYESGDAPEKLSAFYDGDMVKRGWTAITTAPNAKVFTTDEINEYRQTTRNSRFYMKDGVQVALQFGMTETGKTAVSICEFSSGATSAD